MGREILENNRSRSLGDERRRKETEKRRDQDNEICTLGEYEKTPRLRCHGLLEMGRRTRKEEIKVKNKDKTRKMKMIKIG